MPLPRWRLIAEKLAAILLSLVLILAIMFVALVIATRLIPEAEMTIGQAAAGIWHIFPISCCIVGVTLLLSMALRSSRTVGGLAALFVLGGFFVRSLADATGTPFMQTVRRFSLYDYYSALDAMVNRIPWETDLALLALALALYGASVWQFGRRDVGV
jgi:ABC-type transport system involved in multi-copper enzyme maturation permease subunit